MSADPPFDLSRSRAVLIGTSEYQDQSFTPLAAAENSLNGMRQILTDRELCGWPAQQVKQLHNESDQGYVYEKLDKWAKEATNVFLLYYVGHGTTDDNGELCLTFRWTQGNHPDTSGLGYRHIRRALLHSTARVKIVILDCCYAGRAIGLSAKLPNTAINGTYVLAAADQIAQVPKDQELACTSFTGELLELIRTGVPDGPKELTLEDIYPHLLARLTEGGRPEPRSVGMNTVSGFRFCRNAAFLEGERARFPREPEIAPEPDLTQELALTPEPELTEEPERPQNAAPREGRGSTGWSWQRWSGVALTAVLLAAAGVYTAVRLDPAAPPCGPAAGTPPVPGSVVIGSDQDAAPEDPLIAYIYRDALSVNGVPVDTQITASLRAAYYDQVCSGEITIVPEYNGALLTTSVDKGATDASTSAVDSALDRDLPPSLEILDPAPAQDQDSVTVTSGTAREYNLHSIADLHRVHDLKFGAPVEFNGREQGTVGLKDTYGLTISDFQPLDYNVSSANAVNALVAGEVTAADIATTTPEIQSDNLVVLSDPKGLFRADNVIPLVYKPAVEAYPKIATILNYVSLKLTQTQLKALDIEAAKPHASLSAIAAKWTQDNLGAH